MASFVLKRPTRPGPLISLVPMIDVMLILLVFFMVTSTYLNLDMIPALKRQTGEVAASPSQTDGPLMLRLGADGVPVLRGEPLTGNRLEAVLRNRLAESPLLDLLVLPSAATRTQDLISVMDSAARTGVTRMRVIRLEARP